MGIDSVLPKYLGNFWYLVFFLAFIGLNSSLSFGQEAGPEIRQFKKESLDALRDKPQFQYDSNKLKADPNFWQRFKAWLRGLLISSQDTETKQKVWYWVFLFFSLLVGIIVIFKFMGGDMSQIFKSNRKLGGDLQSLGELGNLQAIDFDIKIQEAIQHQEYAEAIRWQYLKALRLLDEKKIIQWQREKTNLEYAKELKKTPWAKKFEELNYWFAYAHYGDFPVSKVQYENQAQPRFEQFLTHVTSH